MKIFALFFLSILFLFPVQAQTKQKISSPDNCEGNGLRLSGLREKWRESRMLDDKSVVILIAKLGEDEDDNQLNERRLYAVSKYLNLPDSAFVAAQGEKTAGLGIVEVYIDGVWADGLTVKKGGDIKVGICDNDVEDNRRYQLPKSKVKTKCD